MTKLEALGMLVAVSLLGALLGEVWGWWAMFTLPALWIPASAAWYTLLFR